MILNQEEFCALVNEYPIHGNYFVKLITAAKDAKEVELTLDYILFKPTGVRYTAKTHSEVRFFLKRVFDNTNNMISTTAPIDITTIVFDNSIVPNNISIDSQIRAKEEKKNMFNFDFGKITSDTIRMSPYGIAVKNVSGNYVSYDSANHAIMDVEIMNMPAGDFLYKMPVAIKDIKAGDMVIHNRTPMFVVEVHESTLKVIDVREGTEKEIYPTRSPFGFNFVTKVVSLMDMSGVKADEENPFGAMLPFMMMGDGKFDPMLFMLMGMGKDKMDMSNPMMMYFLMKG